jgi:hypothetical protein
VPVVVELEGQVLDPMVEVTGALDHVVLVQMAGVAVFRS